jgi:hypothetical protein
MIVQMSGLGQDHGGRFGNQIFSYFFLKVVEAELGCETRHPSWLGKTMFSLPSSQPLLPHDAAITFEGQGDPPRLVLEHQVNRNSGPAPELAAIKLHIERGTSVLDVSGSFQYHTASYAPYRALFRQHLRLNQMLTDQLDQSLISLGLLERPIICIHIRRGDYLNFANKHPLFWGVSEDAIARALMDLTQTSFKHSLVYLCSDDLPHCMQTFDTMQIPYITSANVFNNLDKQGALMVDFMMMARAKVLMIANSSLSFAAATINDQARVFLRPSPKEDCMIPFDPWNSHVLLPKHPYQFN